MPPHADYLRRVSLHAIRAAALAQRKALRTPNSQKKVSAMFLGAIEKSGKEISVNKIFGHMVDEARRIASALAHVAQNTNK
jgi:hypothetical protein